MGCIPHTAFWCAAMATTLMTAAFAIPLWLGRVDSTEITRLWALFYRLECKQNGCFAYGELLSKESVPLLSGTWDFDLVVIPVLVIIGLIFCIIGITIMELLTCKCCGADFDPRKLIVVCAFLFLFSGILSLLALLIAIYMLDKFYNDNPVTEAIEFPWAAFVFAFATILVFISAILYFWITCKWFRYCEHYGYPKPWYMLDDVDGGNSGVYRSRNTSIKRSFKDRPYSNYRESLRKSLSSGDLKSSFKHNGVAGFTSNSDYGKSDYRRSDYGRSDYGRSDYRRSDYGKSDYGLPRAESNYFDFRLSRNAFKKSHSAGDVRKSTVYDSPKILRNTSASEYIRDEQDSLRASRVSRREAQIIDPLRLSSRPTAYRESMARDMIDTPSTTSTNDSISRSTRTTEEPTVLDILYRESRKHVVD